MSREFRLAGLLRLRRLEEEQASAQLADRNHHLRRQRARADGLKASLSDVDAALVGENALRAVAAARAASTGMFAAFAEIEARAVKDVDDAGRRLSGARTQVVGLEKLEARHTARTNAEDQAAEQLALDEVASQNWHRNRGASL